MIAQLPWRVASDWHVVNPGRLRHAHRDDGPVPGVYSHIVMSEPLNVEKFAVGHRPAVSKILTSSRAWAAIRTT